MSNLSILQNQSAPKMTSREIAELTGKAHGHILRDCANMFEQLEIPYQGYIQNWTHPQNGNNYIEYVLDKDLALCLVSGYSAPLRLKIITRLSELESKQAAPQFNIPQTLPEALRLAADLADQLAIAAPKVAVYDLLADTKGDVNTTIVAKELGTTANKLNQFLRDAGVKWLNADLPKAGYEPWFNVVALEANGGIRHQCLVTPKGQLEIAGLWNSK